MVLPILRCEDTQTQLREGSNVSSWFEEPLVIVSREPAGVVGEPQGVGSLAMNASAMPEDSSWHIVALCEYLWNSFSENHRSKRNLGEIGRIPSLRQPAVLS